VGSNFDILERYYEQTLAENRLLSRSAIEVSIPGFLVILVGVGLAFSGLTTIGVVSSVAGLLSEAATVLFFAQLREQVKQVQDYHKKLVSTQYLMTSIALTHELRGDRHDMEIVRIINNLLFLSNELHGSKSDHLATRTGLLVDNSLSGAAGGTPVQSATTDGLSEADSAQVTDAEPIVQKSVTEQLPSDDAAPAESSKP